MKRFAMLALCALGCMSHTERTTTSRERLGNYTGPARGDQSWVYALVAPRDDGLAVDVGAARLCQHFTDSRVTERRVTGIRASGGRFAGVAALLVAGTAFVLAGDNKKSLGIGVLFYGGAVAAWGLPLAAERDKVRSDRSHRERSAGTPAPCIERRLADVRVTLREGGRTHEATTDSAGHAVFPGVAVRSDLELFVEDVAVHDVHLRGMVGPARYPAPR